MVSSHPFKLSRQSLQPILDKQKSKLLALSTTLVDLPYESIVSTHTTQPITSHHNKRPLLLTDNDDDGGDQGDTAIYLDTDTYTAQQQHDTKRRPTAPPLPQSKAEKDAAFFDTLVGPGLTEGTGPSLDAIKRGYGVRSELLADPTRERLQEELRGLGDTVYIDDDDGEEKEEGEEERHTTAPSSYSRLYASEATPAPSSSLNHSTGHPTHPTSDHLISNSFTADTSTSTTTSALPLPVKEVHLKFRFNTKRHPFPAYTTKCEYHTQSMYTELVIPYTWCMMTSVYTSPDKATLSIPVRALLEALTIECMKRAVYTQLPLTDSDNNSNSSSSKNNCTCSVCKSFPLPQYIIECKTGHTYSSTDTLYIPVSGLKLSRLTLKPTMIYDVSCYNESTAIYMLSYLTQLTSTCTDLVIDACRTVYMPTTSTAYATTYTTLYTSTAGDGLLSTGIYATMQGDMAELDEVGQVSIYITIYLACVYTHTTQVLVLYDTLYMMYSCWVLPLLSSCLVYIVYYVCMTDWWFL